MAPIGPPNGAKAVSMLAHKISGTVGALALALAGTVLSHAEAASWPQRPVTVIVPYAAGGMADIIARLVSHHLSRKLGQPFIVDNHGGGAGAIGAIQVANAPQDGTVLMFTSPSAILTVPMLQRVPYEPASFVPISIVANLPFILGIKSSLPPKTLADFIDYAHANPGKLNYASAGVGGISHLVSSLFVKKAGIDAVHVPYKSAAPATAALLTGEVDMNFGGAPELMQHLNSNRITILATSSANRLPNLPNTPTISELYPGFEVNTWLGFVAPRGTPQDIIDAMAGATEETVGISAVAERLLSLGAVPVGSIPMEFAVVLMRDRALYRDAIKSAGIPLAEEKQR